MKYTAPYLRERTRKGKAGGKIVYYQGILRYKNENGTWRQITKTFNTSKKKEAKLLLQQWHEEMEQRDALNPNIPPSAHKSTGEKTVKEAVSEFLNMQHSTKNLEESTYQTQTFYAKKHIYPYLGHYVFKTLTAKTIQDWENQLQNNLSINSVGICHSILRKTYKKAFIERDIAVNPFDYVTPPRKTKTPINYLDVRGKKKLLVALSRRWDEDSPMHTAVLLALYTGMRSSEICALKWSDVKLVKRVSMIRVQSAIGRKPDGKTYLKGTKNKSSDRRIPINPIVHEVLSRRRDRMKKELAESDAKNKPSFNNLYVVGDIEGNYLSVTYLGTTFGRFVRDNKINGVLGSPISMHGLRHTFATDGVKYGMDIKSLASVLGHAKADMTLNTYASDDIDAVTLAMDKLSKAYETEVEEDF